MVKELLIIPLLEKFIRESTNGKRRQTNGERIKLQTVKNYHYALNYLAAFEEHAGVKIRVKINIRNNEKQIQDERHYWKKFYRDFSDFLYEQKHCYDNFAGHIFKTLKCFFRYLKNDRYLQIQECYESFYVRRENIRIIALLPQQFCFLVMNEAFQEKLSVSQKKFKDMFVFGCMAALRHSDLMNLLVKDVERRCGNHFLVFRSLKTDTPVSVKLPPFAMNIFEKYARRKKPHQKLFSRLSLTNFNKNLQRIAEKAGWTESIGKYRSRNGRIFEIKTTSRNIFRFCDLLSSHTMRRTGITMLLMLGMPEYLVRKISGHAAHSKEFFRYVHVAQSFITDEIDKVHQKLLTLYQ